ncbi:hypothetical protein RhiJN_21089 [Ceratobasidium sp. AG-Ba]|nr:hypothetical protein RhiJN_21089 [Ceratobasidium sp. AG-Ba]
MSAPPPAPQIPPPVPDPKLNPAELAASLPQAQLEDLRYKIQQIMESINGLMVTLTTPQNTGVGGGLAGWPELMTKYSVLLSKTHSLAASLSAPPTRKGQASLKAIAPAPFATDLPLPLAPGVVLPPGTAPPVMDPQQLEAMFDALLDGRRSQSVLKTDINNVARLRLPKDSAGPMPFGGGGISIGAVGTTTGTRGVGGVAGVREGPMTAEELRAEQARLDEVIRAHDARCARGVEAVRQLKDKYDWKSRLLFDDSDTEVGPLESEAGTHPDEDGEDEEKVDEDMVEVAPDQEEEQAQVEEAVEMEDETPVFIPAIASSDSESEEEQPLAVNVGGGAGGIGGVGMSGMGVNGEVDDGSDSDGMEDISVAQPFAPPQPPYQQPPQMQYNGGIGANGGTQAEPSPVSALDNLFTIDQ